MTPYMPENVIVALGDGCVHVCVCVVHSVCVCECASV